ncbi:hypothetical protein JCM6882_000006 [Rhodosporidiobolus microsporus]
MAPRPRRAAAARAEQARALSSTPAARSPSPPPVVAVAVEPAPAPPPSINSPTIPLGASHRPGYAFHANLFFASTEWLTPLRADVDALLSHFKRAWEVASQAGPAAEMSGEGGEEERFSPMEVFKGVWERKGWGKAHLMGLLEGPVRSKWGESIVRAFVDRIDPDEDPLKQVGALFALYTFWSTQPDSRDKLFIRVDPPTFEHILSLHSLHGTLLDSCPVSPLLAPPPSADLALTLQSLISQQAFLLVPTQTFAYPSLPCVRLQDASEEEVRDVAAVLLGAEEEMENVRAGRLSAVARRAVSDEESDDEDEEGDGEEDEGDGGADDLDDWGTSSLSALLSTYAHAKIAATSSSALTATSANIDPSLLPSVSTLHRPQNQLHLSILAKAERQTREALAKLGPAAGGTASSYVAEGLGGGEEEVGGLLRLLDGAEGGGRGKRRRVGGGGGGLAAFKEIVREMQERR